MRKTETSRFIYSAYANSISAVHTKPMAAFMTDAPSAALGVSGGLVSQTKENLTFNLGTAEIIRVGRASAKVLGERTDDGKQEYYISVATATVEKLNILDVVTADRVVAKVTSVFPVNQQYEAKDTSLHPAKFSISGSHFDNFKINGEPYNCVLNDGEKEPSFQVKNGELRQTYIFTEKHRQIYVEQFGMIHMGEKYMYGGRVILSMFRIDLGCPDGGCQTGPVACTNGRNTK
jgi:hypothetical protein